MTESSFLIGSTSGQLDITDSGLYGNMSNTTTSVNCLHETSNCISMSVPDQIVTYTALELLVFGLCGNVAIILVLLRDGVRRSAPSVFLFCMALADSATLVLGLLNEWLESSGTLKFTEISPWTCRWKRFLQFSAGDTATWLLVVFSLDRCWNILHTVTRRVVRSPTSAFVCSSLVLSCALLKNLHIFWTRAATYDNNGCLLGNCKNRFPFFSSNVLPYLRHATVSIVPFLVIVVCNSLIIKKIVEARRRIVATTGSAYSRTMVMCVSASVAFLLLECPVFIVLTGREYWPKTETLDIAFKVTILLTYVNHSINVLLYCGSNSIFRRDLWALVTRKSSWRQRQRQLRIIGHRGVLYQDALKRQSALSVITAVDDSTSESHDE